MDISKQLEAYEVEYHVLQEEMSAVHRSQKGRGGVGLSLPNDTTNHLTRLQIENEALRRQKTELLDQLQVTSHIYVIVILCNQLFHEILSNFV